MAKERLGTLSLPDRMSTSAKLRIKVTTTEGTFMEHVQNPGGSTVTGLPVASFTPSATGLSVIFTDTSTDSDGNIVSWAWAFGDGATSTIQSPSHTYAVAGTYNIVLTVTDNDGKTDNYQRSLTVSLTNVNPVAGFTYSSNGLEVQFTDASSDSDGTIASRSWNFGDGGTSTETSPSHTYASADTYTVTLTVTDDDGAPDTDTQDVTVSPLNVAPTADFTHVADDLEVQFTDASTDGDGSVVSWSWNFGDGGTSTETSPSHTYASADTYTVTLTVTDDHAEPDSISHDVTVAANVPPTAAFTASADYLDVSFDGSGSFDSDGSIVSYAWIFGDTGTGTGVSPSHTYAASGTYTVRLTVTDNDGAPNYIEHDVTVTAANVAPTAVFTSSANHLDVSFDGSGSFDSDGSIVSYAWIFGDTGTGTGVSPSHTYAASGTYTVRLTVTDNDGAPNYIEHDVTVVANAVPIAAFTSSSTYLQVSFDGSTSTDSDGSIVSYAWTFGDTGTGTGVSPSHTYAAAGTYTVRLTVTDDDGATNYVEHDVTVTAQGITRVQGPARGTSSSSTITVTMFSTPTTGNVLIAVIGTYRTDGDNVRTVSSISGGSGAEATWHKINSEDYSYNAPGSYTGNDFAANVEIWMGIVSTGSTTVTITISGSSNTNAVADICEYSGIATASPYYDRIATSTGTDSTPSSTGTTSTTTQASELWIGGITITDNSAQNSPTNGFTLIDGTVYGSMSLAYLEKVVSTTGAANSGTSTSGNYRYVGCIATFKGTS